MEGLVMDWVPASINGFKIIDLDTIKKVLLIANKQSDAIQRVRELHKSRKTISGEVCDGCETECDDPWESIHYMNYPCPTIKALDGE
jgi:hypothetical protein